MSKAEKRPKIVLCTFKDSVKQLIMKDGVLLVKISNLLDTDLNGIHTMLKRDSQTLFHIVIMEAISEALKIEIKYLKNCKR